MESGRRKSVFVEVGLGDEEKLRKDRSPAPTAVSVRKSPKLRLSRAVRFRMQDEIFGPEDEAHQKYKDDYDSEISSESDDDNDVMPNAQGSIIAAKLYRLGLLAGLLAIILPFLQMSTITPVGVSGGAIPRSAIEQQTNSQIGKREDSPTQVCRRWSGQCKFLLFYPLE